MTTKFDTVIMGSSDDYKDRIARLSRQLKTLDLTTRFAADIRQLIALYEDMVITIDKHRRLRRAQEATLK